MDGATNFLDPTLAVSVCPPTGGAKRVDAAEDGPDPAEEGPDVRDVHPS